jgi:hypothetical protein
MPDLITAIVVVELPAIRAVGEAHNLTAASAPRSKFTSGQPNGQPPPGTVQPKFVLVLPHGDPAKVAKNVSIPIDSCSGVSRHTILRGAWGPAGAVLLLP